MRVLINSLSVLAIIPLVLILGYFGLIGLMGAFDIGFISLGLAVCICISAFSFRPNDYGSILGFGQIVHLLFVGLAIWFLVVIIEDPGTDSESYRPIYLCFSGIPILVVAPFLHRALLKKEVEQSADDDAE